MPSIMSGHTAKTEVCIPYPRYGIHTSVFTVHKYIAQVKEVKTEEKIVTVQWYDGTWSSKWKLYKYIDKK